MSPRRRLRGTAVLLTALASCGGSTPYIHNRHDYERFRSQVSNLLEPNYLPFMATPVEPPAAFWLRVARRLGLAATPPPLLVFCHWDADAFPLRVHVAEPALSEDLLERLAPPEPAEYVAAVDRALRLWERGLEGGVRFARVADRAEAVLRIELSAEPAPLPDPDVQVLGSTRLGDACRVRGDAGASGGDRLDVRFHVSELRIFVADQHGLLLPEQVERIALHEIGHALGMHGHSPIPADLMYRVVRDRLPRGELGIQDVNSFVSLYAIPNGTIYERAPESGTETPQPALLGPPRLALAPHVDARLGFEVQLPEGWTRVPLDQGVVAVDGVSWDYDASLQVLARAYPSLDAYLERYAAAHVGDAEVHEQREIRWGGRRGLRLGLLREATGFAEELTFLESGDGRVVVMIAECPMPRIEEYRPWFDAVLGSLELRSGAASDRDYGRDGSARP